MIHRAIDNNDTAAPAYLVLDSNRTLIFANQEALRILAQQRDSSVAEDVFALVNHALGPLIPHGDIPAAGFASVFFSGRRRYACRVFRLTGLVTGDPAILVTLQRSGHGLPDQSEVAERYSLTGRETELLSHLMLGLTNKEIGERMQISPNTVKAFLKLMMTKMGVSTRAAVVGRAFEIENRSRASGAAAGGF